MIEYSHAMGNSNGNFAKYWDLVRRHDVLQGGWIWDFADQSLSWPVPRRTLLTETGPARLRGEILAPSGTFERGKGLTGARSSPATNASTSPARSPWRPGSPRA